MTMNGICILICAYATMASAEGPRCPPGAPGALHCVENGSSVDDYFYEVKGSILQITYSEAKYYHLTCRPDVALDDAALPRFRSAALVSLVKLTACAPPAAGYARALLALNVSAGSTLELAATPAAPALRAQHLRGLAVTGLALSGVSPLNVDPDLFGDFEDLRDLRLSRVELSLAAALRLPPGLLSLNLVRAAPELSATVFARLPRLERLLIRDERLRALDVGAAEALRELQTSAPLDGLTLGATVEAVRLFDAANGELRGNCSSLRQVTLQNVTRALPAAWLAHCGGVREVRVAYAPGALGADELRGARALERLEARHCGLRELPAHWLAEAPALLALNLSHNKLEQLPSLLANKKLQTVEATHNRLGRAALAPLAALPQLHALALDGNPLHELCGHSDAYRVNALSPLRNALALRSLRLRRVNATRVCRDWRVDLPQLAELDLRDNAITGLEPADLEWRREAPATVDLRGNELRFEFTQRDYAAAAPPAPAPGAPLTTLLLDELPQCDCREYWFARVWRERGADARVALRPLRCGTRALLDVPLEELACDVPQGCPAGCRCRATGVASELRCAGLSRVPHAAPPLPPARALLLAGNNISHVRLEDVTPELEVLDLRNNSVARIGAAATAALFGAPRLRLLLSGNPLDCSCAALPLLRALDTAPARVADLPAARCAGGQRAAEAAARAGAACARLPLWPALGAALALAAASALGAACLARPAVRHRFKRFLFERGLCLRWVLRPLRAAGDERRPYDAFVSFSHLDRSYADELARRLEPARRLCLHERDWVPGDWIPAQIARSVRQSRRTLVLLSDNFLASTWARAELREAYAAALRDERPRLLLLLLPAFPAAAAAGADPALRAYLASVTYLRWDDPRLWDKLRLALPPRAPAAAPAPAPAPPAPPPPP